MRPTSNTALHPNPFLQSVVKRLAVVPVLAMLAGACSVQQDSSPSTTVEVTATWNTRTAGPAATSVSPSTTAASDLSSSTENPTETSEPKPTGNHKIAEALVQFAQGDDSALDDVRLADEVALVLHDRIERTVDAAELEDRDSWKIESPGYAEFVGPFSAPLLIADQPDAAITIGTHPHCAGPALDPPVGFEDHVQISIQPAEGTIDSCIPWYAVDLFYDEEAGTVDAISVALFGP